MKNIAKSEVLKTFDERRDNFKPYGLTCEKWTPKTMMRFDRHNEIEINFVPEGSVSYRFPNRCIEVPQGRLTLFWGLLPHRVEGGDNVSYYYVATLPMSIFLDWELPVEFVNDILNGGVLMEKNQDYSKLDAIYFSNWISNIGDKSTYKIILLELQSRLMRLAGRYAPCSNDDSLHLSATGKIEEMALYIAKNYATDIKVEDVSGIVGLNSDYATAMFKRAFGHTIKEHIVIERIAHAQRKLLLTNSNILQISYDCGFNSVSSFNMAFKKINGCTPREYRRYSVSEGAFGGGEGEV